MILTAAGLHIMKNDSFYCNIPGIITVCSLHFTHCQIETATVETLIQAQQSAFNCFSLSVCYGENSCKLPAACLLPCLHIYAMTVLIQKEDLIIA